MRPWNPSFAALAVLVLSSIGLRRGTIDLPVVGLLAGLGVVLALGRRTARTGLVAVLLAAAVAAAIVAAMVGGFSPGVALWVRFARKGAWSLAATCALWFCVPPAWAALRDRLAGARLRLGSFRWTPSIALLVAGFFVLRRLGADHPLGPDAGWFLMNALKGSEG